MPLDEMNFLRHEIVKAVLDEYVIGQDEGLKAGAFGCSLQPLQTHFSLGKKTYDDVELQKKR